MEKNTERRLAGWLKSQARPFRRWLMMASLAGFAHGLLIILQAWLLAQVLHGLVIESQRLVQFYPQLITLVLLYPAKGLALYIKESCGFEAGAKVRYQLRSALLDRLDELGPAEVQRQATGHWSAQLIDQVEKLQDYYSKYLPQLVLVTTLPFAILAVVYPMNWAAGLIFTLTAPLTVLFMALVGMGAADANRRNFLALARLSGFFLDRVRGLDTLRQFDRLDAELKKMDSASDQFRRRTMEVLRMAFLSSAVLEFFAAISIAVVAVYFGFSFLGELNFGHYDQGVPLFTGLLVLMLAPEFFQPFRELGAHYHAKAQALGAAETLAEFLNQDYQATSANGEALPNPQRIMLEAKDLIVLAMDGTPLTRPVTFKLPAGQNLVVSGASGAGKSALSKALQGFLPYQGSLRVNGVELSKLNRDLWLECLTWLGQNPVLLPGSINSNLQMANGQCSEQQQKSALEKAHAWAFVENLPGRMAFEIGDDGRGLSVGQAQRIALARAMLKKSPLLILDEPTASLDRHNEQLVEESLIDFSANRTTVWISHRQNQWQHGDQQLEMEPL